MNLEGLKEQQHFDISPNQLPNGDEFPSYIDGENPIATFQITSNPHAEQNFYIYLSVNQIAIFLPSPYRLKCTIVCVDFQSDLYNLSNGSINGYINLIYANSFNADDKGGILLTLGLPRRMAREIDRILAYQEYQE